MVPAGPTNSLHRLASSASAAVRAARAWSRPGRSFSRSAPPRSGGGGGGSAHARVKYGGGKASARVSTRASFVLSSTPSTSAPPSSMMRFKRAPPVAVERASARRVLQRFRAPPRPVAAQKTRPPFDASVNPENGPPAGVVSCRVRPRPGRVSGPPWRRRASRALGRCTSPVGRAAGRFSNHRGWSTRPSRSSRGRRRPQPLVPPLPEVPAPRNSRATLEGSTFITRRASRALGCASRKARTMASTKTCRFSLSPPPFFFERRARVFKVPRVVRRNAISASYSGSHVSARRVRVRLQSDATRSARLLSGARRSCSRARGSA